MSSRLPERIDPERLVQQGQVLKGRFELAQMARVSALLAGDSGSVEFELVFGRDAENRPVVQSHISADLRLTCQRCLEPVIHEVDSRTTLGLVTGLDEARDLPEEYESLLLEEPTVSVRDMVEEDLLLAIPAFPRHASACSKHAETGGQEVESRSANPFSVLGTLKNGKLNTEH
jgi:uncharacterized protein